MGESRLNVKVDFVIASSETHSPPPQPPPSPPLMAKINSIVSRNNSYNKLPSQPLTLSVLKLDGSLFHVEVSKNATVAELKQAVEVAFSDMPHKISWRHVWGQFCLCYEGQKLVVETDYLKEYGIQDGVQLRFIRQVSNNSTFPRKRSKKKRVFNLKQNRRSTSQVNAYQQIEQSDDEDDMGLDDLDIENGKIHHSNNEEEECVGKSRLASSLSLGGFFSYTRLEDARKSRRESRRCPSLTTRGILDSFRNIREVFCLCGSRQCSLKDTWRE